MDLKEVIKCFNVCLLAYKTPGQCSCHAVKLSMDNVHSGLFNALMENSTDVLC